MIGAPAGASSAGAGAGVLVASRCNSQTIDDAATQVRDDDRRGPGRNTAQQLQRYGGLTGVISVLNEEREILDSLCASDTERAALFAQIAATGAWALALQADIAAKLNGSCPAAAQAFQTMMIADAWLTLANIVNNQGGTVPSSFQGVIPKVQMRAQALGLTLPPWSETSAYWRDQVRATGKAQIATCPSPSPSAGPT